MNTTTNKKRVFVLGAGASKSYAQSPTGERMPIAKDFFKTFDKLSISCDQRVLIGDILNVARDDFGISYENCFKSDFDIEQFHSHVESKLIEIAKQGIIPDGVQYYKAYIQLISLFASVINEIQNGPTSIPHKKLIDVLTKNDCIITFNWDTLLDRALHESGEWDTDYGYCVKPRMIFRNQWEAPKNTNNKNSFVKLIKLHGSSNWITSYPLLDNKNIFKLSQTTSSDEFYVYENTDKPYPCHKGRFEGPYQPFSYFYYPPNILDDPGVSPPHGHNMIGKFSIVNPEMPSSITPKNGLTSIPLIIPPVKEKKYKLFGNLFTTLWKIASDELEFADEIIIIGYSFPQTDKMSINLFKTAFCRKQSMPTIKIIDPYPENILHLIKMSFGITEDKITTYREYFSEDFDFSKISV